MASSSLTTTMSSKKTRTSDSLLTELRVDDFPRIRNSSISFLATPVDDRRIPERILLNWHDPPVSVRLGDVWRMEVRLRRPRGAANPGSMDFEAWLFRERIGASGYVVSGKRNVLLDSNTARGMLGFRIILCGCPKTSDSS